MINDAVLFDLIQQEYTRQNIGIELIASENITSFEVMKAMGSVLTNKYAEGYPNKRYYGGCEVIDQIEQLAIDRLKEIFSVDYANVQPHSGAQANSAVMLACLNPGDTILGLDLSMGGHLTHGSPVNYSGKIYKAVHYGIKKETGLIDYDMMEAQAIKHKPKLLICGASAYSRDWDYQRIRKIADQVGSLVLADIAHPAGLIAAKELNSPFEYCHIITSTTHKTLRGPRGGIIMMKKNFPNPWGIKTSKGATKTMATLLNLAVFPGTQGGPLEHVIAGKAVAFYEILQPDYKTYIKQVIANAKAMENELKKREYHMVSGGTSNHLILIDLRNKKVNGKEIENWLVKADITLNKNMVPFDNKSPFITSGIRIGTPAITSRGMKEEDMPQIIDWLDRLITNLDNEKILTQTKEEVNRFMEQFPLYT